MADRWLAIEGIAQHIGIEGDSVCERVRNRKMPAHKVGRLLKFQAREVDKWVRSGKVAPDSKSQNSED